MTSQTLIAALTPIVLSLILGVLNYASRPDTEAKWMELIDASPKRAAIHRLLDAIGIGPHDLIKFAILFVQKKGAVAV
jgi:hypothetical protein